MSALVDARKPGDSFPFEVVCYWLVWEVEYSSRLGGVSVVRRESLYFLRSLLMFNVDIVCSGHQSSNSSLTILVLAEELHL